jgi:precorrin-6A/cobalt-precorrin-6A reductase
MPGLKRVLLLGGTSEGRALALACADLAGIETVSSLAGRTSAPLLPPGAVRVGGFGGVPGLVGYLRAERVDAIVDATHPFAATMSSHAAEAAAETDVPLLVLRRPGWSAQAGDDWHRVPSPAAAAALVPKLGARVFLTTGRQTIAAFAGVDECWFLARSVEAPEPPMPARVSVVLDRGPFTVDGERALLAEHRIEVLVTKDSGGTAPKLAAARERALPVVVIDRPAAPETADQVTTISEAVAWLTSSAAGGVTRIGDLARRRAPAD